MKKTNLILLTVLLTAGVFAQSPEKMSYQAVIRDSIGILVTDTQIGMEINILQGSASGSVVYTETQTPITNSNGLISIEIGSETGFSSIDWANNTYYIETKTAIVAPLTTYTITGVSQLLSVPYALHTKTAESITGTITETDPVYTISQAANITAGDITHLSNLSGINTGDQDGSETKVIAGTNVTVSGSGTIGSPYMVSSTGGSTPHVVGDSYQGGKIFWLDATGQHGLIAATEDQSTGIQWSNGTTRITATTGDGLYAGLMNTTLIIANQIADDQEGNFAAKLCADYSVIDGDITYGDWYLPSKYELNLLYLQRDMVGGFSMWQYWSSTEYNFESAWLETFYLGLQATSAKYNAFFVRAIRAF
jgi:hypothetical protein